MTEQYWIAGFFVDLSRNQITQNQQTQTLAPKALAVLTYLAQNQGKVINPDELLDKIWQDTVVSPNTLQKSIAQLRKALGDDGKGQVFIKTHAKKGYSLECDVRWNKAEQVNPSVISVADEVVEARSKLSNSTFTVLTVIIVLLTLSFIVSLFISSAKDSPLTIEKLTLLTATDDKEFDATYSPDGQHIVFHRYLDKTCVNNIWAKDIHTQKETQLTKNWGEYGIHSFSQDGNKLIFLATQACNQPLDQKSCYNLVSLDFDKALQSPQEPEVILQCKNSLVKKPIWLNNNDIVLMQKTSSRWKLITYSMNTDKSIDLFELPQGNLIDYAYSPKEDLIAVSSIHENGKSYIEMLKPDGTLVSSRPIQYPDEIPKFRPLYPNFSALDNQLIFSTGRQLFTLSYEGKVHKISSLFADTTQQPHFHPNGNRLLMIKGPYDSDIVKLPLQQIGASPSQKYQSFERSNQGDSEAIFQPLGDLIAFWSKRSGIEQLWLSNGNGAEQLTHFPLDTYIRGFDWAANGKSLLINANSELTLVNLDSSQKNYSLPYSVVQLYQWNSERNTALVVVRIKGLLKYVEYNLNDLSYSEITDKKIAWAMKTQQGKLIYKDLLGQFWQSGTIEDELIQELSGQGGKAKSFVLNDDVVYAINDQSQLWSYSLKTENFRVLGNVPNHVDYLTDANQEQLLMTIRVSAKKEVVELEVSGE